ncbi:MAG TPA: hypothetical protein VJ805_04710 [Nitrospiraceae bacterium]|nr:hypothetical protein [Nitrospiraceae bacterium]
MALAARTAESAAESTMDIPTLQPPGIRIKNRLIGTIVAQCNHFPHDTRMLNPPRWVSHLEDNQWPARVVLAAYHEYELLVVVKILGRFWTFTSTRHTSWLHRPPRAWDRVTVHIPLDAISSGAAIPAVLISARASHGNPPREKQRSRSGHDGERQWIQAPQ